MHDYQQNRVYAWEQKDVPAGDWIPFENVQESINYIWFQMGLKYSPKVSLMRDSIKWAGKANRNKVFIPAAGCSSQTLLHELAHSMTMNQDGVGHQHNEYFVGIYMILIEKFMNIAAPVLWYTAKLNRVKYKIGVKPTIIDSGVFYR